MRGLGITRGFDKSRKNGWFICVRQPDGRRPKQYFPDLKARDKAFATELAEIRQRGVMALVSASDRQALAEMKAKAAPTGLTILEIFHRGLKRAAIDVRATGAAAATVFLAEQKRICDDGHISRVRLKELGSVLRAFVRALGDRQVSEIVRPDLKTYFEGMTVGPQTRLNHARTLSFFFKWAIREGYASDNPVPAQRGVDRIPTVFSNEQVAALFEYVLSRCPELTAMMAVQWFAGLRPGASHHLTWEDVDFERGRLLIQPHGNKLRQPDIVQDVPPTVFGLLASVRRSSGRVAPANHLKLARAMHETLGFRGQGKDRWPEDVARHTFASNLYALYNLDSRRVEAVLLHSSSAMLRKHYLLKNVPAERAAAYFARYVPSV
jgi:integrase